MVFKPGILCLNVTVRIVISNFHHTHVIHVEISLIVNVIGDVETSMIVKGSSLVI